MGLGSTAKKVQKLADRADDLYQRMQALHEQVRETRETVDDTNERITRLEAEMAAQREVLAALAEEEGIDVEALGDAAETETETETQAADERA